MTSNKGKKKTEIVDDLIDEEDEDTQKDRFLTFSIGNEDYGIEIKYVNEIIGIYKITSIPEIPDFVKGVINLRGRVIPVIDVRMRFGIEYKEYNERSCTIIVELNNITIGLNVDEINEVMNIPSKDIDKPTSFGQDLKSSFVQGLGKVGEKVKIILDLEKLLYAKEQVVN